MKSRKLEQQLQLERKGEMLASNDNSRNVLVLVPAVSAFGLGRAAVRVLVAVLFARRHMLGAQDRHLRSEVHGLAL